MREAISLPLSVIITFILIGATILVVSVVSVLQVKKPLMSKTVFLYVFIPLSLLPINIVITYIAFPAGSITFGLRLLIVTGIHIVVMANFYFFLFRHYKATIPEFKGYFEEEK